jgi:hypothetical protein
MKLSILLAHVRVSNGEVVLLLLIVRLLASETLKRCINQVWLSDLLPLPVEM